MRLLFEALPDPFAKLLIGSAILFYVSELIAKHIEEAGYGSLAAMAHFAVKIAILTLWINQTTSTHRNTYRHSLQNDRTGHL